VAFVGVDAAEDDAISQDHFSGHIARANVLQSDGFGSHASPNAFGRMI
jgi:hypothetical protein